MYPISKEKLNKILDKHKKWLNEENGEKAYLYKSPI